MASSAEKIKAARAAEARTSYGALVGGNAVFAGVDQGIDFTGAGPVYALGEGQVTKYQSSGSGWPGEGGLLVYLLTGGPLKGKSVYVAEDFKAAAGIAQGTVVHRGDTLGFASGSGKAPGIEVGYADAQGHALQPLLPPGSSYPAGGFGAQFNTDIRTLSAGGDLAKLSNMFSVSPTTLSGTSPLQSTLNHVPLVSQAQDVVEKFKAAGSFFEWITDPENMQRVFEILSGSVLILVGVVMVGRAASGAGPVAQVSGAASAVAAPVRRSPARRAPAASRQATGPISQSSAATRRRAGFTLPADRRPPKRGAPRSSRLAKGDRVPF